MTYDLLLGFEGEDDGAVVGLAGGEGLRREVGLVGSVGESLHLDGYAVIVLVAAAALVLGRAGQPVAGVDLHAGLVGADAERTARFLGLQHHGVLYHLARFPAAHHPAVVVALADLQSGEIGLDIASDFLGHGEIHGRSGHRILGAEGYLHFVGRQVCRSGQAHGVAKHAARIVAGEVPVGVVGKVHHGLGVGGGAKGNAEFVAL